LKPTRLNSGDTRPVTTFEVLNAENPQVEREQLNRILKELSTRTGGTVGADGAQGPAGPAGADGAAGADGVGVPTGGITGQALVKASGADYDTEWQTLASAGFNPATDWFEQFTFFPGVISSSNTGTTFITNSSPPVFYIGAGGSGARNSQAGYPVYLQISTGGTNSTGYSRLYFSQPFLIFGDGTVTYSMWLRVNTLSTSGQRFLLEIGWCDNISGASTDRLVLALVDNVNSGNFTIDSVVGGVSTSTSLATAPTAGAWHKYDLVVNAAGTSMEVFMDGVSIGTTSGVPTAAMALCVRLTKSVGTSARTVDVWGASYRNQFTTPK
jgi:hypothetical protein